MDAFNQAAESLWNKNSHVLTRLYAIQALEIGTKTLLELTRDSLNNTSNRTDLSLMSLYSGLAISHTRTALCHSISYPLTSHYGVPHGLACAFTMPEVYLSNIRFDSSFIIDIQERLNIDSAIDLYFKFQKINNLHCVSSQVQKFIPSLDDLLALIPEMYTPSRAKNNLNPSPDLTEILVKSWNA